MRVPKIKIPKLGRSAPKRSIPPPNFRAFQEAEDLHTALGVIRGLPVDQSYAVGAARGFYCDAMRKRLAEVYKVIGVTYKTEGV